VIEELRAAVRACKADFKRGDDDELIVRAILQRLREPSDAMVEAGFNYTLRETSPHYSPMHAESTGHWQAMLDAITAEGE